MKNLKQSAVGYQQKLRAEMLNAYEKLTEASQKLLKSGSGEFDEPIIR